MADSIFNLHTKKEAFIKGAYLERPEKFDILAAVDEKTSIKNAKNSILMTYKELVNTLSGRYTEASIHKTLIELKLDNLIAVVPALSYNETNRVLVAESYIVCRPEKKSYDIADVYHELVERSTGEVSSYAKDGLVFNRDAFWKDLESSMLEDEHSEVFYPEIYFSIDFLFEMSDLDLNPEKEIYNQFKSDLMKAIVLKRKAVELFNNKIFLLSDGNLEEISRTLSAFFYNRILPQYETVPVVARGLDVIKLLEEIHKLEFDNRQLVKFTAEKTYFVQKYFEEEKYKDQSFYPGRIVFKLIHALEKFINEYSEKKYIEHIYTMYEELKNKVCNRLDEINNSIYFFTEQELEQYPQESVEKVVNERSIVSTTWERRGGTVYVFMEMTFKNFSTSLEMLSNLSQKELWKILAFRKLLQDSQKIKPDVNPFNNAQFHKNYSVLLNNAYQTIIPFYYNIFLWIPVDFIQDMVYRAIKKFVSDRQKLLAGENQAKRNIKKQIKLNQASLKKKYLKRLLVRNRILEELDFFYFKQNLIPSISDVKERFPDLREQQFIDIIEEFNFLVIPTESSSHMGQKILYYPKTITWGYSLEKTKSNIELWLSIVAESSKSNNDENKTLAKRFHALNMKLQLI
jgi:hypothetical protein